MNSNQWSVCLLLNVLKAAWWRRPHWWRDARALWMCTHFYHAECRHLRLAEFVLIIMSSNHKVTGCLVIITRTISSSRPLSWADVLNFPCFFFHACADANEEDQVEDTPCAAL